MALKILGPDPRSGAFPKSLRRGVATIFPRKEDETLVTEQLPGGHFPQISAYLESVERARRASPKGPLTRAERDEIWESNVRLRIQEKDILIQTESSKVELAFLADDLLRALIPRHRVRFLTADEKGVVNDAIHDAIKRAGGCWRIAAPPIPTGVVIERIRACQQTVGGHVIYYRNPAKSQRLMTCQSFRRLASLNDSELCEQLIAIQVDARNRELDFFAAGEKFRDELTAIDEPFVYFDSQMLRTLHQALGQTFEMLVPPELQRDDLASFEWRERMLDELYPLEADRVREESRLGLAAEFHMHVQWLPGGRLDHGEFKPDPFYDDPTITDDAEAESLRDEVARGLVHNHVRDFAHLEYINIGRIAEPLMQKRCIRGRRGVYIVQLKETNKPDEIIRIIRLQKWDVSDRLDDRKDRLDYDKSLLEAMIQSAEYTGYVLDRRLGCRRLTMNLPEELTTSTIREIYRGKHKKLCGTEIWTPYFERDYVPGIATNRLPTKPLQPHESAYARKLAELLGHAAAPNMIVGRCGDDGSVFFDDGDEVVVIEPILDDDQELRDRLVVTHHTGAFASYREDLSQFAAAYAAPVNSRVNAVPDPQAFADTYLRAFVQNFKEIQELYRQHRQAFDTLFRLRPYNREGAFAYRWECVLTRLDKTDAETLAAQIRRHFNLPATGPSRS